MSRYRKLPVEIDAIQWLGWNPLVVKTFSGNNFRKAEVDELEANPEITGYVYDKLHSTWVGVKTGDYIIRGVQREYYPCDESVFRSTYELVG